MTSTTTTTDLAATLGAAELDLIASMAAADQALAEAGDRLAAAEDRFEKATEASEDLISDMSNDRIPVDADALDVVDREVRFAQLSMSSAKTNLSATQRAAGKNIDTSLASLVAPLMATLLPSVEILTTFIEPVFNASIEAPLVCVVQKQKPSGSIAWFGGGAIAGQVEVSHLYSPLHRQLVADDIKRAGEKVGLRLSARRSRSVKLSDSLARDVFTVSIDYAVPAMPTVTKPRAYSVGALADELAVNLFRNSQTQKTGAKHAELIEQHIDNGIRLSRVRATVVLSDAPARNTGGGSLTAFESMMQTKRPGVQQKRLTVDEVADQQLGQFLSHVGRVTAIESVKATPGVTQVEVVFVLSARTQ